MNRLSREDYVKVLEAGGRIAKNGLAIFRLEPGERLPVCEWANDVVIARSKMTEEQLLGRIADFFALGDNVKLAYESCDRAERGDESPFEVELTTIDGERYWLEVVVQRLAPGPNGALRYVAATRPISRWKRQETFARLLAAAVDQQPDGVLVLELDRKTAIEPRLTYLNSAFTRLTGYDENDFAKEPYPRLQEGDDLVVAAEFMNEIAQGRHAVAEFPIVRKDGSRFWAEVRGHPIESPPVHAVVIMSDISQRRLQQEEMALLSEAVSNASDFIIVTDAVPPAAGGPSIIYVNRSFLDATGYEETDLIGRPYQKLFSRNTPALMEAMRSAITCGEANYREALIARKDGTEFWVELVDRPFTTQFGRSLRLSISRDITLRRRASSQLSLLFTAAENAPTPIIIYEPENDRQLAIAYENEAAVAAGSYHLRSLWINGGQEGAQARERLQRGEEFSTTYTHVRPDGGMSIAQLTASAIRSETRLEAILTQERYLDGADLVAVLPTLSRGRTLAERTDALRILLRTAFDAELTILDETAEPGEVRIDQLNRTAKFTLDGRAACVSWSHALPTTTLTALRLCIETAIDGR